MAKKRLLIAEDYDFLLFGISCAEKTYRLCFALNHKLNATFSKSKDMETMTIVSSKEKPPKKLQCNFPVFIYKDEEMFADYRIIVNKSVNRFLIPEFKQADYLLMVQGDIPLSEKSKILKKVKEIAFVQTVFEIDPQKIKSKENLLF